jgi:hypothetical protein
MDKSIKIISFTNYSPRFKPWAMRMRETTQNRFNGLSTPHDAEINAALSVLIQK